MDDAALAARCRLLVDPLVAELIGRHPHCDFTLDVEEALERPGAPILLAWVDGPAVSEVLAGLAPAWGCPVDGADPAAGAYPISTARSYSPVLYAHAVLRLHADGQLAAAAGSARGEFIDLLHRGLQEVSMPGSLDSDTLSRAELLAEIAGRACGRDVYTWAAWLSYGGGDAVVTAVLPATLLDTRPAGR